MTDVLTPTGRIEIETRNAFYLANFDTKTLKRVRKDDAVLGLRGLYRQKWRDSSWLLSRPVVFSRAENIVVGRGAQFWFESGDGIHTSTIVAIRTVPQS